MGGTTSSAGTSSSGGASSTGGASAAGGAPFGGGGAGASSVGGASTGGGTSTGGATGDDCGTGKENDTVTLTCPAGEAISAIVFASYGTPTGSCGAYMASSCDEPGFAALLAQCEGEQTCAFTVSNDTLGGDPCKGMDKHVDVEVSCAACASVPQGTLCSGVCVNEMFDADHCGSCTKKCNANYGYCNGGTCACDANACDDYCFDEGFDFGDCDGAKCECD